VENDTHLVPLSAFEQALVEAKTIPEIKNLVDQVDFFRQWLRKQKAGHEALNAGLKMKLMAERKLGGMLDRDTTIVSGRPKNSDLLSPLSAASLTTFSLLHCSPEPSPIASATLVRVLPSEVPCATCCTRLDFFRRYIAEAKENRERKATGTFVPVANTWEGYCKDIGIEKRNVFSPSLFDILAIKA